MGRKALFRLPLRLSCGPRWDFSDSLSETVRKGVRVALRLQIWCVYGGRNRLKQAFGRPVGLRCRLLRDFSDSLSRDCPKSGPRVVVRYPSTHENALPNGSFRRRMELHRASSARSQRTWTAEDRRSSRGSERRLLRPKERLPVAPAPSRLPSMAYRLPLFQDLADRWGSMVPGRRSTWLSANACGSA